MRSGTEGEGFAYRYGGEEIAVILPGVQAERAFSIAESLRVDIAAKRYACYPRRVTASFGVGTASARQDADRFVAIADEALYRSKAAGRNRVTAATTS